VKRCLVALTLALAALFGLVGTVSAHAVLERADPAQGSALNAAPQKVILGFDESVDPTFSKIGLYDREGKLLPTGPVVPTPEDPAEISATLPKLSAGIYTVIWQVVSADGHVVKGAYPFAVGQSPAGGLNVNLGPAQRTPAPPPLAVLLHWLQYAAALLAVGAAAFGLLVLPVLAPGEPRRLLAARAKAIAAVSALALAAAYLFTLPEHAAQVAGVPLWRAFSPALLGKVAASGNWGHTWSAGLALAVLLGLFAHFGGSRRAGIWATTVTGLLLLLSIALGGHAVAVQDGTWLAVTSDTVHLAAAALWLGGLPLVLLAVRPLSGSDPAALRRLVGRFSTLAAVSVGLILLTGTYQALLQVPEWAALLATAYGITLVIKLALVLLLLLLGAYNLLAAGLRLNRGAAAARGLGRAVRSEIAVALGVLVSVAVLTALPPARVAYSKPFAAEATAGDLTVKFSLNPARAGYNQYDVLVTDAGGRPVADALRVRLSTTMTVHEMASENHDLPNAGGGHYRDAGSELAMSGPWLVTIQVRRKGVEDVTAIFAVNVSDTP